MFKINYKGSDYNKVEKIVTLASAYVLNYFGIKNYNIIINILDSREEFDRALGEKTADWIVGNSDGNVINIFSPTAMGKQGGHKSTEFNSVLTHEMTHSILERLVSGKFIPVWLNEGISAYIAKQHQSSERIYYVEENFCQKLGTHKGWDENVKYGSYKLAALFVSYLIKKYSFEKIKQLLTSLDKVYYYKNFQQLFFKVYGKTIDELESEFVKFINK